MPVYCISLALEAAKAAKMEASTPLRLLGQIGRFRSAIHQERHLSPVARNPCENMAVFHRPPRTSEGPAHRPLHTGLCPRTAAAKTKKHFVNRVPFNHLQPSQLQPLRPQTVPDDFLQGNGVTQSPVSMAGDKHGEFQAFDVSKLE